MWDSRITDFPIPKCPRSTATRKNRLVLFGLVRQAEKPKQALKVRRKFVVLLMKLLVVQEFIYHRLKHIYPVI